MVRKSPRSGTPIAARAIAATPEKHTAARFLLCYLCGRQFSRHSLPFHQPQCYAKKFVEWEQADPATRGAAPILPTTVPCAVPPDSSDATLTAFNAVQEHIIHRVATSAGSKPREILPLTLRNYPEQKTPVRNLAVVNNFVEGYLHRVSNERGQHSPPRALPSSPERLSRVRTPRKSSNEVHVEILIPAHTSPRAVSPAKRPITGPQNAPQPTTSLALVLPNPHTQTPLPSAPVADQPVVSPSRTTRPQRVTATLVPASAPAVKHTEVRTISTGPQYVHVSPEVVPYAAPQIMGPPPSGSPPPVFAQPGGLPASLQFLPPHSAATHTHSVVGLAANQLAKPIDSPRMIHYAASNGRSSSPGPEDYRTESVRSALPVYSNDTRSHHSLSRGQSAQFQENSQTERSLRSCTTPSPPRTHTTTTATTLPPSQWGWLESDSPRREDRGRVQRTSMDDWHEESTASTAPTRSSAEEVEEDSPRVWSPRAVSQETASQRENPPAHSQRHYVSAGTSTSGLDVLSPAFSTTSSAPAPRALPSPVLDVPVTPFTPATDDVAGPAIPANTLQSPGRAAAPAKLVSPAGGAMPSVEPPTLQRSSPAPFGRQSTQPTPTVESSPNEEPRRVSVGSDPRRGSPRAEPVAPQPPPLLDRHPEAPAAGPAQPTAVKAIGGHAGENEQAVNRMLVFDSEYLRPLPLR
eukprot:TRINITY_DN8039_c0_g1_i1.p1 TRINITY_DN8039_c0_g1~~TRINITY_DN8039_c0_g1_i1.p1  ORF type:complete len:692 (-),score=59.54 TRINITY_DN8039_c0_g1_i1:37-2112(-)